MLHDDWSSMLRRQADMQPWEPWPTVNARLTNDSKLHLPTQALGQRARQPTCLQLELQATFVPFLCSPSDCCRMMRAGPAFHCFNC